MNLLTLMHLFAKLYARWVGWFQLGSKARTGLGFQTLNADLTEIWVISQVRIVAHTIGFGKIQNPIHFVELRPSTERCGLSVVRF